MDRDGSEGSCSIPLAKRVSHPFVEDVGSLLLLLELDLDDDFDGDNNDIVSAVSYVVS